MEDKPAFVQVKVDAPKSRDYEPQKAMQQNKTVVIYNRINNYILAVFLRLCLRMTMLDLSQIDWIYLATGKTDLSKEIDGLVTVIIKQSDLDPYQNILFFI